MDCRERVFTVEGCEYVGGEGGGGRSSRDECNWVPDLLLNNLLWICECMWTIEATRVLYTFCLCLELGTKSKREIPLCRRGGSANIFGIVSTFESRLKCSLTPFLQVTQFMQTAFAVARFTLFILLHPVHNAHSEGIKEIAQRRRRRRRRWRRRRRK